ncbi:MAG: adenylate/guanylate cyclase domain-containing protein [Bacteroidota bacterium]
MMQRNQAETMAAVKGYEAVLKARIQSHGGNLLQTYGNRVDIASRVESMGIAGAVLLSSSIRQQIKNRFSWSVY